MIFGRKKNKTASAKSSPAVAVDIATASVEQLLDIVCDSEDPALRASALANVQAQEDLAVALKASKFPDVRLTAAERLEDEALMRAAYNDVRQRDKNASRVLKTKLDDIDANRQEAQSKVDALQGVMSESKALATGVWSPAFNARYQALLGRWQHMEDSCSMAEKLHFQANQRRIEETLEEHRPRLEAPAKLESVCESLELICGALQQASLMEAQIACEEWGDIIAADETRWREAAALCEPEAEVKQRYDIASTSLHEAIAVGALLNEASQESEDFSAASLVRLSEAVAAADWRMGDAPIWFFELNALIEEVRDNQAAAQEHQEQAQGDIHKAFASLRRAIKDGRLLPAKSMASRLQNKLDAAEGLDTQGYQEQLTALNDELAKLLDWKDFATTPKYEALCEEMEQLAEVEVAAESAPIEARVDAVKALQNAWKELGRSDASEQYWQRFQDAGHKAYEPAKLFFEELKRQREHNLQKRQALCEQLTAELEQAIETDSWQELERQAANAQRAWHNYKGVERTAGKQLKVRFDHLLERISVALEPQYEAGISAKEGLIQKMQALVEADISQHVVNQTKALQAAWKTSGMCRREDDQRLWQQFNELCGRVFEADRNQRKQRNQESRKEYDNARTIIDQIKALKPEASLESFQELQQAFTDIQWQERDPKGGRDRDADKLKKAYERACDQYETARDRLTETAGKTDFEELQRRATLCAEAELSDSPVDEATFMAAWNEHPLETARWLKAIEQRKAKMLAGEKPSAASVHARRLLCVQLEILLDQESPSEDKPLRMEYQLSQLQNRNRKQLSKTETLEAVREAWYTSMSATADKVAALEARFQALLERA